MCQAQKNFGVQGGKAFGPFRAVEDLENCVIPRLIEIAFHGISAAEVLSE